MTIGTQKHWLIAILLVLFCILPSHELLAQSKIEVSSFLRMESDITARVTAPKRDQNGEVCALIRIVTNVKDLMFEPDALGITARENKTGEIWLYVPRGSRRITIMHDQLGILRNYFYPDIIDKATVYEMIINAQDGANKAPVESNTQLIVMRLEPTNATINIDDAPVPTENGLFTATMKKGEHSYRIEAPMYQSEAGIIDLGAEQKIMSVTLKPKFGYLEIMSLPEQDARVYIDNKQIGVTPYKSDRLPINQYKVRIEKETYFPIDTLLNITAGETLTQTFKMISTIKPKAPRRTLAMLEVGYHPSQTSYGAMIGIVRKNGGYIRFRSDFGSVSTELECDDSGALTSGATGMPYYNKGVTKKARMSVTGGYLRQLWKPLYLYVGAGYGDRVLAWETVEGNLVKNTDHSATGAAVEIGAIGRIGKFSLSVGFQTVNFTYHEANVGFGIMF